MANPVAESRDLLFLSGVDAPAREGFVKGYGFSRAEETELRSRPAWAAHYDASIEKPRLAAGPQTLGSHLTNPVSRSLRLMSSRKAFLRVTFGSGPGEIRTHDL